MPRYPQLARTFATARISQLCIKDAVLILLQSSGRKHRRTQNLQTYLWIDPCTLLRVPKYKTRAAAADIWPKSIFHWPAAWFLSSVDNVTSTSHQSPSPIYSSQHCHLYWPKGSTTPWGPFPSLGNYGGNSFELKENEVLTVHWTFNYNKQDLGSK